MLQYQTIPVTPFQQNCSIVWCDETAEAVVIDPGGDLPEIQAALRQLGVTPKAIWLTHAHIDHAGGAGELARQLSIPIIGPHPEDQFLIETLPVQAMAYGFPPALSFTPQRWLHEGDSVEVGRQTLQVHHTPGHTPGHVIFHAPQNALAFTGDVLFAGSIGRTDFPRGNHAQLIESIVTRLWPLGGDTRFVPGHGPESSLARERASNPFVAGT